LVEKQEGHKGEKAQTSFELVREFKNRVRNWKMCIFASNDAIGSETEGDLKRLALRAARLERDAQSKTDRERGGIMLVQNGK